MHVAHVQIFYDGASLLYWNLILMSSEYVGTAENCHQTLHAHF